MDNETETVTMTKNLHNLIKKAVVHFLRQIIDRPEVTYFMLHTETFELMEEAYASICGKQAEDVHREIMHGIEKNADKNKSRLALIDTAGEMLEELEAQRRKHCFASSGVGNCDTCWNKDDCSLRYVINKAKGIKE
jgi:hypothetical protein